FLGIIRLELCAHLASGVSSVIQRWEIRCKNSSVCSSEGTDFNHNNQMDFVLSRRAFMAMAMEGIGQHIFKLGIL
ncbi:hypothetical protein Golob_021540, partial [Gossypium lobatum]|nr:hypothetical protein [Gossypium lobatum]